jgi:putative ABC transport system substrate-binding protein
VIGRREFITLLGGAAAWPIAASAQQPTLPTIGYLQNFTSKLSERSSLAFLAGLKEMGYIEGQNLRIERRVAEANDRLSVLALELINHRVAAIFAFSLTAATAAKTATETTPIVFVGAGDPVRIGLVAALNRPGGNVTGITNLGVELGAKRLQLMRDLVPQASIVGVLSNQTSVTMAGNMAALQEVAKGVGQELVILQASTPDHIDAAFATAAERGFAGLLVDVSLLFSAQREQIVTLAARYRIVTLYPDREFVEVGGLASYGASFVSAHHQAGIYVGRILKGENPADLPVVQPTKYDLVINLTAAKALKLDVAPTLLALADEVIE